MSDVVTVPAAALARWRRQAKELRKKDAMPHHAALDAVARLTGVFRDWHHVILRIGKSIRPWPRGVARFAHSAAPRPRCDGAQWRIWTPPRFASRPFFGGEVRLLTYIRPLSTASIYRRRAMMGYSRACSPSLIRAFRTSSLSDSAGAGSTCLPSSDLLSNRG